jgi:hypothetical protein
VHIRFNFHQSSEFWKLWNFVLQFALLLCFLTLNYRNLGVSSRFVTQLRNISTRVDIDTSVEQKPVREVLSVYVKYSTRVVACGMNVIVLCGNRSPASNTWRYGFHKNEGVILHVGTFVSRIQYQSHINILLDVVGSITYVHDVAGIYSTLL